jgi:hypothetical protein
MICHWHADTKTADAFNCKIMGEYSTFKIIQGDDRYPQWIYPFASCIDIPLPKPDEQIHIMTDFKLDHVDIPSGKHIQTYARYAQLAIEEWYKRHGFYGTYMIEK